MGKPIIIGVATFAVVAVVAVIAVTMVHKNSSSSGQKEFSATTKAVQSLCSATDFQTTCQENLAPAAGTTTDPNQLVKIAFNVTMGRINEAMKNTTVLQQAEKDPRTADAYKGCEELLVFAIEELERTVERYGVFDLSNIDMYLSDLKTWLSATVSYQETCLDGFENSTNAEAGEKMKQLLKVSGELSQNALAMVDEVSKRLPRPAATTSRRLLASDQDMFPSWVDAGRRRLLQTGNYNNLVANAVVSKNGPFKTINDALRSIPPKNNKLFVIKVQPGIYAENIVITKQMGRVALIGAGIGKTIITGRKNFADGTQTFKTATLAVEGPAFFMRGITVENTAGPQKHQAVAFRSKSDMTIAHQCEFTAFQDTLYVQTNRQFYYDCIIRGTVDFIFGDAVCVFQKCKMAIRKPMDNQACMVTAQGRLSARQNTGIVIQQCNIYAEADFFSSKVPIKAYLGRPWKAASRTIIMQSTIDRSIVPEGWSVWQGTLYLNTLEYAEFQNSGPGANTARRVPWKGYRRNFGGQDAARFTVNTFLMGGSWIRATGVPFIPAL